MFVIPVKFDEKPYVIDLIKSLRENGHEEKILLCIHPDSNVKLFDLIEDYKNIHIMFFNIGYCDSAIWYAYNNFPDEEHYFLLHDSMICVNNLSKYYNNDFTSYMWFNPDQAGFDDVYQEEYVYNEINNKTTIQYNEDFTGVFGITFCIKRHILSKLNDKGLASIIPSNKIEMQGSERIWGIALRDIGVDVKLNSICGDYFNRNPNPDLIKIFVGRQ